MDLYYNGLLDHLREGNFLYPEHKSQIMQCLEEGVRQGIITQERFSKALEECKRREKYSTLDIIVYYTISS